MATVELYDQPVERLQDAARPASVAPVSAGRLRERRLLILTVILLLISASRIIRLRGLEMDVDEVWSIWQTFGTPAQIIRWTPYDWPPLSYLLLGGWRVAVGIQPIVIHYLSTLVFLLASALFYRVMRKLYGMSAALLGTLAFAAFGYMLYLSTVVRGYIWLVALMPLALWLALRYFARATFWRAALLALSLAAMFYIHLIGAMGIIMIGLYVSILYPRRVWRWWLPGLLTILFAVPEILTRATITFSGGRLAAVAQMPLPPLFQAIASLFADYAGFGAILWALVLLITAVAIIVRWRAQQRVIGLAVWVLSPIGLYLLYPLTGTFAARHFGWVMMGLAICIGWGLATLIDRLRTASPQFARYAVFIAAALLLVPMFAPFPSYGIYGPPLTADFEALAKLYRVGDAVLVDPNNHEATPEEWDYFTRAYFPQGITFVTNPDGYRRVWYVTKEGARDPATDQAVNQGRIAEKFFGPWNFLFRLYESPPDAQGILFANGLRFHGADVIESDPQTDQVDIRSGPLVWHAGETIRLRLWWTVDHAIDRDYSLSTQLTWDADKHLITQVDGPPQVTDGPSATSQWQTGRFYIEERDLVLPFPTKAGPYSLWLTVYQWWDQQRITAPGVNSDNLLPLGPITVKSW